MSKIVKLGRVKEYEYPISIREVDRLTGEEFEMFIFRYLKDYGGLLGELTEKNDYGIDIILWEKDNPNVRYGAQCKRFGPKTLLGENDLMKMQKGVSHYGLSKKDSGKPFLMLFTSAERQQVTGRGLTYIENEEIDAYFRDEIIEILKDLDEKLERNINVSNYNNIAFESSKKKNESFKENSKFEEMLRLERKNISKYNKIFPLYMVYNDKTIEEIILSKPTTLEELGNIKGLNKNNVSKFGKYLLNKIRSFLELDTDETPTQPVATPTQAIETPIQSVQKRDTDSLFETFLKETRRKIATYNKISPIYNVFNNETLNEILLIKPTTIEELSKIKGIGVVKTDLWGSYLIKEIQKYLNENKND